MMNEDTFFLACLIMLVIPYLLVTTLEKGIDSKFSLNKVNRLRDKLNIVGNILMVPLYLLNFIRLIGTKAPTGLKSILYKLLTKRKK